MIVVRVVFYIRAYFYTSINHQGRFKYLSFHLFTCTFIYFYKIHLTTYSCAHIHTTHVCSCLCINMTWKTRSFNY